MDPGTVSVLLTTMIGGDRGEEDQRGLTYRLGQQLW